MDTIAEARRQWTEHGWSESALGMSAVTSLMRAQAIMLRRVEAALKPFGITFARYEVLMLLTFSSRGSLPMSVIGGRLQVHQSSVTNAVDRLERAGLVQRTIHPDDRRAAVMIRESAGVIVDPGSEWGPATRGFTRIRLDAGAEALREGIARLAAFHATCG